MVISEVYRNENSLKLIKNILFRTNLVLLPDSLNEIGHLAPFISSLFLDYLDIINFEMKLRNCIGSRLWVVGHVSL